MRNIQEVHQFILDKIIEHGGRIGITYYRKHKVEYEALPQKEASKYWREIIDTVTAKERLTTPSLLKKKDNYLLNDLFTKSDADIMGARRYRQKWWKEDEHLDAKMANYVIESLDHSLDLLNRIDEIPVVKSIDFS